MAIARLTDHRIYAGWVSVATVTSTYSITAFTRQSDMDLGDEWLAPRANGTTPPEIPQKLALLNDRTKTNGKYSWQWTFSKWTFDQYSYISTTYLGTTNQDGLVTVKTYDAHDTAVYLQAVMLRPSHERGTLDNVFGGYLNVVLQFRGGTIIT